MDWRKLFVLVAMLLAVLEVHVGQAAAPSKPRSQAANDKVVDNKPAATQQTHAGKPRSQTANNKVVDNKPATTEQKNAGKPRSQAANVS